jgi:endonuclease-8
MPEGPSIVILKELVDEQKLVGKRVIAIEGNTKIEKERMLNQEVKDVRSWGKHFLLCFTDFSLRVHFLLFGTYRINERKENIPRLRLTFEDAEINLYGCSVQFLEGDINDHYDWTADVMSATWDPESAMKKLNTHPNTLVCDALLDQNVFAGVGNIIKNEVLFRIMLHPLSNWAAVPENKKQELIQEAQVYSFEFLQWKKEYTLKAHWLAHTKKTCPRCNIPFHKEYLGKTNRRTFYCSNCQKLFAV